MCTGQGDIGPRRPVKVSGPKVDDSAASAFGVYNPPVATTYRQIVRKQIRIQPIKLRDFIRNDELGMNKLI